MKTKKKTARENILDLSKEFFQEENLISNPRDESPVEHTPDEASNGISLARFLAHKNKLNDYFEKKLERERNRLIDRYFGKDSESNILGKFMTKKKPDHSSTVTK
ncbi:hypothetical protein UR09_01775 [Candidatus Nitromaritima sp. SCGC AAA799-A02]|nr:hypothetical protein UR09_01775 [Candidatus Nitromaritima sp. SCGC AAA799-A02]